MTEERKTEKVDKKKKDKKEKKTRGKFNILDALIVLCVLSVIVLLIMVYSPWKLIDTGSGDTALIYSVRVYGVPAEYAGSINIGDKVSDSDGYDLGRVASAVEVEPNIMYIFDEISGGVKPIEHPDLVDLIITVSATADADEDGYRVDGRRIAAEAEYELLLPGFEASGICISLSEENANDAGGAK